MHAGMRLFLFCLLNFSLPVILLVTLFSQDLQGSGLCSDVTPPALALLFILVSTMPPPPPGAHVRTRAHCMYVAQTLLIL